MFLTFGDIRNVPAKEKRRIGLLQQTATSYRINHYRLYKKQPQLVKFDFFLRFIFGI